MEHAGEAPAVRNRDGTVLFGKGQVRVEPLGVLDHLRPQLVGLSTSWAPDDLNVRAEWRGTAAKGTPARGVVAAIVICALRGRDQPRLRD